MRIQFILTRTVIRIQCQIHRIFFTKSYIVKYFTNLGIFSLEQHHWLRVCLILRSDPQINCHKTVICQPELFCMEFSVDSQMRSHTAAAFRVGGLAILLV